LGKIIDFARYYSCSIFAALKNRSASVGRFF